MTTMESSAIPLMLMSSGGCRRPRSDRLAIGVLTGITSMVVGGTAGGSVGKIGEFVGTIGGSVGRIGCSVGRGGGFVGRTGISVGGSVGMGSAADSSVTTPGMTSVWPI